MQTSEQQIKAVRMALDGMSGQEIADALSIEKWQAEYHVIEAQRKLQQTIKLWTDIEQSIPGTSQGLSTASQSPSSRCAVLGCMYEAKHDKWQIIRVVPRHYRPAETGTM